MSYLFLILMGWTLGHADSGGSLQSSWAGAIEAYHSGNPAKAAEDFDLWIEAAGQGGLHSFEAHYNAGLAHGYAAQGRQASLHFIQASRLTLSPFRVSTVQRQLAKVQRELGVQESLVNDFVFTLRLFLNPSMLALIASLLLWSFLLTLTLAFKARDRWTWGLFALNGVLTVLCVMTVALSMGSDHQYGVVSGLSAINVTENDGEKLLELPPGTLVSFIKAEGDQIRILSPISGYANDSSVERVPL